MGEKQYAGGFGRAFKNELIRTVMTRLQGTFNSEKQIPLKGTENVNYDDVKEYLNVPYVDQGETALAMDIFSPANTGDMGFPVIVTIHGGGLVIGDRGISRPFGRLLAHKGYLVFSLEYRLAPGADFCEELGDIAAGMDSVSLKMAEYHADPKRVFLVAESAGALLALYSAAMCGSERLREVIGSHSPHMEFAALGLNCGMFYPNEKDLIGWLLSDQIYGSRREDENFMEFMNPEHPEIINNLPPVYLSTSRGDFLNNYSIKLHLALENAGVPSHFVYYPDEDLDHAFFTLQTHHPTTYLDVEKMLEWLEEQAVIKDKQKQDDALLKEKRGRIEARISDGSICSQPVWRYVRERGELDPERSHRTAVFDCSGSYTYQEMYDEWERYARVFSALQMTGANNSRVGIAGPIAAETLFSFYGLNMTGAVAVMLSCLDFLPSGSWKEMIEKEKITDLVLSDIMITPKLWNELKEAKETLGLRNLILIHSRMGGPCIGSAELTYDELNYHKLKQLGAIGFMDDLLVKYSTAEIIPGNQDENHIALIVHTFDPEKRVKKPLPFTERAVNLAASSKIGAEKDPVFDAGEKHQNRIAFGSGFSSFLMLAGVNAAFASGNTAVLTFFGHIHPGFVRAVSYYMLDVLFVPAPVFDSWLEHSNTQDIDFSSLKLLGCGGPDNTPEKRMKYQEFAEKHGYRYEIAYSYARAEAGGVEIRLPENCGEDIPGCPLSRENFRILADDDRKFHMPDEGARTGTLYMTSDFLCENTLDGVILFEYTEIEGRKFFCTGDKVRVNEDGSISYIGSADPGPADSGGISFDQDMALMSGDLRNLFEKSFQTVQQEIALKEETESPAFVEKFTGLVMGIMGRLCRQKQSDTYIER